MHITADLNAGIAMSLHCKIVSTQQHCHLISASHLFVVLELIHGSQISLIGPTSFHFDQ